MNKYERAFYLIVILALLIFAYNGSLNDTYIPNEQAGDKPLGDDHLQTVKERAILETLNRQCSQITYKKEKPYHNTSHQFNEKMYQLGINNPVDFLITNLIHRKELIPFDGSLGGTYGFHFRDAIRVCDDSLVFAIVDDGHSEHNMILKYDVIDSSTVNWEVVFTE